MKKKKLNWKKVIISYFILLFIFCILLFIIPNYYKYNILWLCGFISGMLLFTALIEGSDKK